MYLYVFACICLHVCIHLHVFVCTCMYLHMLANICVHFCVFEIICMFLCMYAVALSFGLLFVGVFCFYVLRSGEHVEHTLLQSQFCMQLQCLSASALHRCSAREAESCFLLQEPQREHLQLQCSNALGVQLQMHKCSVSVRVLCTAAVPEGQRVALVAGARQRALAVAV